MPRSSCSVEPQHALWSKRFNCAAMGSSDLEDFLDARQPGQVPKKKRVLRHRTIQTKQHTKAQKANRPIPINTKIPDLPKIIAKMAEQIFKLLDSNSPTTYGSPTHEEMKPRLERFSEIAHLTPPSKYSNSNLHTAISISGGTIKPYWFTTCDMVLCRCYCYPRAFCNASLTLIFLHKTLDTPLCPCIWKATRKPYQT